MAKILCIETSTEICSVAIVENGIVTDIREDQRGMNHSRLLTVFIDELMKSNKLKATDIDAVAVSEGPGSYTGLRIGVSVAKGFCYATSIPLIAISPLEAMAHQVINNQQLFSIQLQSSDLLVPMIDAKRMEVYRTIFNIYGEVVEKVDAVVVDELTFVELLNDRRLLFFGNGANKCKAVVDHPNAVFIENVITSANNMATLAQQRFEENKFVDLAYFEPFYLKDFIATIPRNKVLGG